VAAGVPLCITQLGSLYRIGAPPHPLAGGEGARCPSEEPHPIAHSPFFAPPHKILDLALSTNKRYDTGYEAILYNMQYLHSGNT